MNLLVEKLAAIEHRQWVQWATKLLEEEPYISRSRRARWEGLFVSYEDLPEEWKEYDREWARHVLREVRIALGEILEEEM